MGNFAYEYAYFTTRMGNFTLNLTRILVKLGESYLRLLEMWVNST